MINVLGLLVALMLVSYSISAEEEETQAAETPPSVDTDAAIIEQAKQRALARKKQQIQGYQPITVTGQEIDATYLEETSGDQFGVIVFFNNKTQALETPTVIRTLRQALPQYGWSTISFAMDYPLEDNILLSPSLEAVSDPSEGTPAEETAVEETPPKEVVMADDVEQTEADEPTPELLPPVSNSERIEAIISFIKAKDYPRTIFVALGEGGEIAADIMAPLSSDIDALILLESDSFSSTEQFETIFKPIVDIYAQHGKGSVKKAIKHRKKIMKVNEMLNYSVRSLSAADTRFLGAEQRLTQMIRSWLYKQFLAEQD